jgi:hypothetical protein
MVARQNARALCGRYHAAHHVAVAARSAAAPNAGAATSDAASKRATVPMNASGPTGHSTARPNRAAGRASIISSPHTMPATYVANPTCQTPTPMIPTRAYYCYADAVSPNTRRSSDSTGDAVARTRRARAEQTSGLRGWQPGVHAQQRENLDRPGVRVSGGSADYGADPDREI